MAETAFGLTIALGLRPDRRVVGPRAYSSISVKSDRRVKRRLIDQCPVYSVGMTHELDEIRASMVECERLEALLEAAKARRTQLATRLYTQNGPTRTYMLAEIPGVCDAVELLVSRTKARRDGTVSYFFAEKGRWRGVRPTGTPEAMVAVQSAIPLTGRLIEATASLTGRSQAGDEPEHSNLYGAVCDDLTCSVCKDARRAPNEPVYDLSHIDQPALVGAILDNAIPRRGGAKLIRADEHVVITEDDFKARRVTGPHAGRFLSELCSVCGEPQYGTPSGVTCPNGHGGAESLARMPTVEELEGAIQIKAGIARLGEGLFKSLSSEELESVPVPSQAELEAAIEQGGQDKAAFQASRGGVRLPIVGEGRPEPRLLQITEAMDSALYEGLALTAEQLGQDEVDPDQAILDELLADM